MHRISHKKRKTHHRKHKVSGIGAMLAPKSPLVVLGSLALGYFSADTINEQVDKILPASFAPTSTDAMGWVAPAAKIGLGALLLLSKKPSLVKTIPGGIIAGAGVKQALRKAGVVSGYQSVPVIGKRVAGYQSVPVIGATPAQLQGYRINGDGTPAQLQGYTPNGSGVGVLGRMGNPNGYGGNGSGITSSGGGDLMN